MGFLSFQKWCFIFVFVLMTSMCVNSFRLIHTSQQSRDIKRPDMKELTKKLSEIKHEKVKEKFANDSIKSHLESLQKPVEIKKENIRETPALSTKKIKTIQPVLPLNITKQNVLQRFKASKLSSKSVISDKLKVEKSEKEVESTEKAKLNVTVEKTPRNKTAKAESSKLKDSKSAEKDMSKIEKIKKAVEIKLKEKDTELKRDKSKEVLKQAKVDDTSEKAEETKRKEKDIELKRDKSKEILKQAKVEDKIEKPAEAKIKEKDIKLKLDRLKEIVKAPKVTDITAKPKTKIEKIKDDKKTVIKESVKKLLKTDVEKKTKLIPPKNDTKTIDKKKILEKDLNISSRTPVKTKITVTRSEATTETTKSSNIYFNVPSFYPNFEILQNENCKKQGQLLIEHLNKRKIWALKMIDATAKIPSGILRGNLNQFGDYDECLSIFVKLPNENKTADIKISGKYCLADIDIETSVQEMKLPVNMAQGRSLIRSKNQDPGHFAPRFTTIRWALCIPSACTSDDAQLFLEDALQRYEENNTGLHFNVSVKPEHCNLKRLPKKFQDFNYGTLASIGLTLTLVLIVSMATVRDIRGPDNEHFEIQNNSIAEKIFMSFSLKRTVTALLKRESEPDEIECINGVRTIGTFLLYLGHKLIPIGHMPFTNKISLTEVANHPISMFLRVSVVYTDSFLLLSGVLTSYRMSKDMDVRGHIPWFNRIFARYIRLTPSLIIVLLYYAYIMELTGDGPLWNTIVTPNAKLCQENGWQNLLYIQNIYPFQDMCATHTHQLALDMQLSLIAPILVWLLYRRPFMGVVTTLLFHCISVILRYYTTLNYRLSLIIYHGISLSQLYRTANLLYASSIHRATPYLAGVGLGVLLRQMKSDFHLPKLLALLGWLVAGYFSVWTFYTPSHLSSRSYQYDIYEAAQYAALCSLAWSLALSWIIFASFADSEGYVNSFLSSRPMVLFSRISYTFYLTQFIVFFYNVGTVRTAAEFKINTSVDLSELLIVIIISTFLTLLVDMPVQKVKTILLSSPALAENTEESSECDSTNRKLSSDSQKSEDD